MVNGVLRKGNRPKDILRNKSHYKCISFSREVIPGIYSEEEYANLATMFIIITSNTNFRNKYVAFLSRLFHLRTQPTAYKRADEHVLCPVVFDLRNSFSLPVNYRRLTHVVGGQITNINARRRSRRALIFVSARQQMC